MVKPVQMESTLDDKQWTRFFKLLDKQNLNADDKLWLRALTVAVRYGKRETGTDKLSIRDERLFAEAYCRGFKAGTRSVKRRRV